MRRRATRVGYIGHLACCLVACLLSSAGLDRAFAAEPAEVMPASSAVVARWDGGEILGASLENYILSLPPRQRRPSAPGELHPWRIQKLEQLLVQELLIQQAGEAGLLQGDAFVRGWQRTRTRILAEAMLAQATAEMQPVGPEQIEAYYQEHLERYQREEAILTRHIFLRPKDRSEVERREARERLEKIQEDILAGADFAEMAKRHSESENAPGGGLLPWQKRGTLHPVYEGAAWALQPGEVSPVVETEWGFHIIRLEQRQEAGGLPLSDVAPRIEEELKRQALQEAEATLIRNLAVRMELESATPLQRARSARSYRLLAEAAQEKGLAELPEVQLQLRQVWRTAAARAGRSTFLDEWAEAITEEQLREFYNQRQAHYQTPQKYNLFVIEFLFQEDHSKMETKLEAEQCARLLRAGQIEAASSLPGGRSFRLAGITPRDLARESSRDLVRAVGALQAGEVSEPIRYEQYSGKTLRFDSLGYWVVRLEGRIPPEQRPLEEVRERVKRDYLARHADQYEQQLKRDLLQKHRAELLLPD